MAAKSSSTETSTTEPRRADQPRSDRAPERELRFDHRMSDAEALMWNVEKDPWLNPNGASLMICDRPIDAEQFRRRLRFAVLRIARLRERVVPGLGRLSPPAWRVDPEFDFDFHLRHISLPAPGTTRQLYDLAKRFYEDPFDRTRPLWLFVIIDGLEGGRGALFWKTHHSLSDGMGLVRLSELYMERRRELELPPEIDLDAIIADALVEEAKTDSKEAGGDLSSSLVNTASKSLSHLWRRQQGIARRGATELGLWAADPLRAVEIGEGAVDAVSSTYRQVSGRGEVKGGSPLWTHRSRRRHLESVQVDLEALKDAGKVLGGSINDAFVTGAVVGSLAYHAKRNTPVDALNISFVVSTRSDKAMGGNSFTPSRVQAPGGKMSIGERLAGLRDLMAQGRSGVRGAGAFSTVAGLANLLPTSVVTRVARSQAAKMDFATSNLRGAPFPMYLSGAKLLQHVTLGPVAGTAFNMTALSYNGSLDIGLFIDPAAVEEPDDLRGCIAEAYGEILAVGKPKGRAHGE